MNNLNDSRNGSAKSVRFEEDQDDSIPNSRNNSQDKKKASRSKTLKLGGNLRKNGSPEKSSSRLNAYNKMDTFGASPGSASQPVDYS